MRTELMFQLTMRKRGPSAEWDGEDWIACGYSAAAAPEKVNARPGEDRAFGQFLSESVMAGETTSDDRGLCGNDHCMGISWSGEAGIQPLPGHSSCPIGRAACRCGHGSGRGTNSCR